MNRMFVSLLKYIGCLITVNINGYSASLKRIWEWSFLDRPFTRSIEHYIKSLFLWKKMISVAISGFI